MAIRKENEREESRNATQSTPLSDVPTFGLQGNDASSRLMTEEVLASRYRILRFIAQGGMGEVLYSRNNDAKYQLSMIMHPDEFSFPYGI